MVTPCFHSAQSSTSFCFRFFFFINKIVTDPTKTEDVVYAATYGGIYRSANGGETWTAVLGGNTADAVNKQVDGCRYHQHRYSLRSYQFSEMLPANPVYGIYRSPNLAFTGQISRCPMRRSVLGIASILGLLLPNENVMYVIAQTPERRFPTADFKGQTGHSFGNIPIVRATEGRRLGGSWFNRSDNLPGLRRLRAENRNLLILKAGMICIFVAKPDNENIVFSVVQKSIAPPMVF